MFQQALCWSEKQKCLRHPQKKGRPYVHALGANLFFLLFTYFVLVRRHYSHLWFVVLQINSYHTLIYGVSMRACMLQVWYLFMHTPGKPPGKGYRCVRAPKAVSSLQVLPPVPSPWELQGTFQRIIVSEVWDKSKKAVGQQGCTSSGNEQ